MLKMKPKNFTCKCGCCFKVRIHDKRTYVVGCPQCHTKQVYSRDITFFYLSAVGK